MSTRRISTEEAAELLRVPENDILEIYQLRTPGESFKDGEGVVDFPEDLMLGAVLHRHPNEKEPRSLLLKAMRREALSLSPLEEELLEAACVLHDSLPDILSMRALETGMTVLMDRQNLFRLPMFCLCLRETMTRWLDEQVPNESVVAAPWYSKRHVSGCPKDKPTQTDKLRYFIVRGLASSEIEKYISQAMIDQEAKARQAAFKLISGQVHFTPKSIEFRQDEVLRLALSSVRASIRIAAVRSAFSGRFGANLFTAFREECDAYVRIAVGDYAKRNNLQAIDDWYVDSISAQCWQGGIALQIRGVCAGRKSQGDIVDIGFSLSPWLAYEDTAELMPDEGPFFGRGAYNDLPGERKTTLIEACSRSMEREPLPPRAWSKVTLGLQEFLRWPV